jgi:hypothetical protein
MGCLLVLVGLFLVINPNTWFIGLLVIVLGLVVSAEENK